MRWLGVINLTWENLQIAKHKSVRWTERTPSWFVLCDLYIFSGKVYHPEPPHAQSLFLFPIVFGIYNLIQFFDGKNKIGLGKIWSFVLGFRSLVARLVPFERGGTKPEALCGRTNFWQWKVWISANFSATMVTSPWRKRREVWREKRKVRIFGKGKCKLIAVRIFGKGKCKFIANFSSTMVTSLPSISLSLSLCISLSLTKSTSRTIRKRFRASYNNTKRPRFP